MDESEESPGHMFDLPPKCLLASGVAIGFDQFHNGAVGRASTELTGLRNLLSGSLGSSRVALQSFEICVDLHSFGRACRSRMLCRFRGWLALTDEDWLDCAWARLRWAAHPLRDRLAGQSQEVCECGGRGADLSTPGRKVSHKL